MLLLPGQRSEASENSKIQRFFGYRGAFHIKVISLSSYRSLRHGLTFKGGKPPLNVSLVFPSLCLNFGEAVKSRERGIWDHKDNGWELPAV